MNATHKKQTLVVGMLLVLALAGLGIFMLGADGCSDDASTVQTTGDTNTTAMVKTAATTSTAPASTTSETASQAATVADSPGSQSSGQTTAGGSQNSPSGTPLSVIAQGATPYDDTDIAGSVPPGSQIVFYAKVKGEATMAWMNFSCYGVGAWEVPLVKKTTTAGVSHWSTYWNVPDSNCSCRYRANAIDANGNVAEFWAGGLSASSYQLEVMP